MFGLASGTTNTRVTAMFAPFLTNCHRVRPLKVFRFFRGSCDTMAKSWFRFH